MNIKLYFTLLLLSCIIFTVLSCGDPRGKNDYTGRYILYLEESDLGIYKDSTQYHQLILTINEDNTYEFNKDVPFINKKRGMFGCKIETALIYDRFYSCFLIEGETGVQKTILDHSNNIFYVLNITPKKGAEFANKLCFKKI